VSGSDGRISSHGLERIRYIPGDEFVTIDAELTADKLEAIAILMRETAKKKN
jgi:hypothetical protein